MFQLLLEHYMNFIIQTKQTASNIIVLLTKAIYFDKALIKLPNLVTCSTNMPFVAHTVYLLDQSEPSSLILINCHQIIYRNINSKRFL